MSTDGDESAFAVLWKRYRKRISKTARSFCSTDEEAEDLVQEVFIRIHSSASGFVAIGSFSAWAQRITRNAGVDHVRKTAVKSRALRYMQHFKEQPDLRFAPERIFESKLLKMELRDALIALPPKQKTAVMARYFDAMSISDIALATGVPIGTVKSRLHNALCLIRRQIEIERRNS